ncbi:Haloacetate dehalogenase H-2 [archaeon HR06]|nr:Haloacetate dehalogenase H-2 [archaeon HR06]
MIKYLTFDVYGTLFDWYGTLYEILKKEVQDPSNFLKEWRDLQLKLTMINTMLGKEHRSFDEITKISLVYTLKKYKLKVKEEELLLAWRNLKTFNDVNSNLKILSKKYEIALLSNGDLESLKLLAKKLPIKISSIISAEDSKAYKPSPKIYEKALEVLKAKKEEILHVSSHQMDVWGAKNFGLKCVWINRYNEPYLEGIEIYDYVVKDFNELSNLLKFTVKEA